MSQLNLIGTNLGRFEILSEIGRGGMAVVYKARQNDLDRIVAIKLLPPDMTHDASYVARFRQEARSAARLEHPHIMPVYEVGEADGLHYIAMKFIQGRTLKELVQQDGALSVRRAAEVLAQVGDALDHAHRQGVIHRDIKPSNIMVTDEGWIYLTDFGLARGTGSAATGGLTMAGTVMGTPEYMSPEQAQGLSTVGPPTDIYALGVVLYELLTGTFPFRAETPMAMLAARLLQAPIPPRDVRGDLPPAVEDVVMRSLARKPEARFASSAEMVAALRVAAGIGAAAPAQPPLTPVSGTPALGETLVAGRPQPQLQTPPYVRPQMSSPPPQPYVAQPVGTPQWGSPAPGGAPPPPATPTMVSTPGAPAAKPKTGLFIGIGAVALLLVLSVVGLLAFIGRPKPGPGPDPLPAPTDAALVGLLQQSDASLAAGDIDKAIAGYQQAASKSAGNTAALSGIAIAYNLRADWPKAEASANKLVNAALSDDKAAALGLTLLADAIASQGGVAEAAEPIQQALTLDGGLPLAHAINATIMGSQALDANDTAGMDKAIAESDKAVDGLPKAPPLIQALTYNAIAVTLAQDYSLSKRDSSLAESKINYQKAIALQPKLPLFHANLGYTLSGAGRYDDARAEFQQALKLDPSYADAQIGIGWSYYHQGEKAKAAAAFDEAIKLNPAAADAYLGKGRLAYDKDDYASAITQLQSATQRNARSAAAYAWLGKAYQFGGFSNDNADQKKQAYASAVEAYTKALDINASYAFAASGLGWVLHYQDKNKEAVAEFQKALKLDDANDESHNGLGWSLFNLDKFKEAEPEFRRAIAITSDYADPHYGLGRTLESLGRKDDARAEYKKTLEIDSSYTAAKDALDRLGK